MVRWPGCHLYYVSTHGSSENSCQSISKMKIDNKEPEQALRSQQQIMKEYMITWASQVAQRWRTHLPKQGMWVWFLGWEDPLEEEMATCSLVFLPGKFHGQRSMVGYRPWGCRQSDTAEWLSTHVWSHAEKQMNYPRGKHSSRNRWKSPPPGLS